MKKRLLILLSVILTGIYSFGAVPLQGIKNIPGDFSSLKMAIDTLNNNGVGYGGVTFNIAAGYTETFTSPVAGYITTNTASIDNPVVFQKSGTGLNPKITGSVTGTSGTIDAVFALCGTDYVTFDRIDVTEPTGVVEYGYALFKASATDGVQNATIKNCKISLNQNILTTKGIYAGNHISANTTALTITDLSGTNSYNKFYGDTITNCFIGISLNGYNQPASPWNCYDQNNEIGKDGANNISGFGSTSAGATATMGIFAIWQNNLVIANNNINGAVPGTTGSCAGIQIGTSTSANYTYNSNMDIYNNYISIQWAGTTGIFYGILDWRLNTNSSVIVNTTNTVNIYSNTITGCTCNASTSANCFYMDCYSGALSLNIHDNAIYNNNFGSTSATNTGSLYYLYVNAGLNSPVGETYVIGNNVHDNIRTQATPGSGNVYYYYISGGGTLGSTHDNIATNNTATVTGVTAGIYHLQGYGSVTSKYIFKNTISNISAANGTFYGFYTGNGNINYIYQNQFYNIQGNLAASVLYGMYLSSGGGAYGNMYVYNNTLSDFKTPAASNTNPSIYGINTLASSVTLVGIYYNTISLNATSTGTNFSTAAIRLTIPSAGSMPYNQELINNIIINTSTPKGTGRAIALMCSAAGLNSYSLNSNNNNIYAGTIYYDGTNTDGTMAQFKSRVYPRETQSFAENTTFVNAATHNFKVNTTIATQCESGGKPVTTPYAVTTDFENDPRSATTPDIGMDEFNGIASDLTPPTITYATLMNTSSLAARTITVSITDQHGVPTTGSGLPRLAWKINSGSWNYATGTFVSGSTYTFSFGTGVVLNDIVSYYVLAQDSWSSPNAGSYPSSGATGFTVSPPAAATPPSSPSTYTIIAGICGTKLVGTAAGADYATLTAAVNDVNAKDITCPVTLLLTDDTYPSETYPIVINQNPGSSATNTLTIKPAYGKLPFFTSAVNGASGNSYAGTLTLKGAQYIIIDGSSSPGGTDRSLTFQNTFATGYGAALVLTNNGIAGASNIIVKNCVLKATFQQSYNAQGLTMVSQTGYGDYHNILIDNNSINSCKFGIGIGGNVFKPASNITVSNNTIGSGSDATTVSTYGITIGYVDTVLVKGNEISGMINTGSGWIQAATGITINTNTFHYVITKNIIHDWFSTSNAGIGIYDNSGDATTPKEISNNVIYNIKGTGGAPAGIAIFNNAGNFKIYHNNIYMGPNSTPSATYSSSCINFGNNNNTGIDIRDNILKNSSATTGVNGYCILSGTTAAFANLNYNDYYADGASPKIGGMNGIDYATLADWQGANHMDANSANINPAFVSDTYLLPTTSAMPKAGLYFTSVPQDINNTNRTNPPDIGAYEFTPSPTVTTDVESNLTYNSVILDGTVNPYGQTITTYFDYGLTSAYGSSVAASPTTVTGGTPAPISQIISGLTQQTTYHFRARGVTGGGMVIYGSDRTFTTLDNTKTFNLKLYLEGLYAGSGTMSQASDGTGPKYGTGIADQITVELHDASNYGTIVYTAGNVNLGTDGTASLPTPSAHNGSYYVTVKHRNSIETVSAAPISFASGTISYNFSDNAAKAYGSNMFSLEDGSCVIYGSDVNQDGIIDGGDMASVDNGAASFASGYLSEDCNGDGLIDGTDMSFVDNNAAAFVGAVTP